MNGVGITICLVIDLRSIRLSFLYAVARLAGGNNYPPEGILLKAKFTHSPELKKERAEEVL